MVRSEISRQTLELIGNAKFYNEWLFGKVRPFLGQRVLEVGGGVGNFTEHLVSVASRLAVMELDGICVKMLRRKFGESVEVKQGDVAGSGGQVLEGGYDTVVCMNVLEHVEDDERAVENMRRWLANRGKLVLLVPAHAGLYGEFDKELGHFRRYGLEEVKKLMGAKGFSDVMVRYVNWLGAVGWWYFMRWGKRKRLPELQLNVFDRVGRWFLWPENFIRFPFGLSVLAIGEKKG